MKVLLNKRQLTSFILESNKKGFNADVEGLQKFTEDCLKKVEEDLKIHFKLLLTWGAAVGGIIGPLNEFIESGNFGLNSFQVASILVATAAILFEENKRGIKKLLNFIEKEGIENVFSIVLNKGRELKQAFLDFVESLNIAVYSLTNIMSYAFLIPLLPKLWEISNSGVSAQDVKEIVVRLVAFGLSSVTSVFLRKLVTAIINRFRR